MSIAPSGKGTAAKGMLPGACTRRLAASGGLCETAAAMPVALPVAASPGRGYSSSAGAAAVVFKTRSSEPSHGSPSEYTAMKQRQASSVSLTSDPFPMTPSSTSAGVSQRPVDRLKGVIHRPISIAGGRGSGAGAAAFQQLAEPVIMRSHGPQDSSPSPAQRKEKSRREAPPAAARVRRDRIYANSTKKQRKHIYATLT